MRKIAILLLLGIVLLNACGGPGVAGQETTSAHQVKPYPNPESETSVVIGTATTIPYPDSETPAELNSTPYPEPYPAGDILPVEFPEGAVIVYQRSGGLAGISETWTIYADGRIVSQEGQEWQVASNNVTVLLGSLEELGFFQLDPRYVPFNQCCDRFTYVLTVQSQDKLHSVTVLEATPDTPQTLWDALAAVSQFIAENTGK